jgi:hypothetical protein
MTLPPCKPNGVDCPRRYVGCRAECKEWHDWLSIHAEEKQRQKQDRNPADNFLIEQQMRIKAARNRDRLRGYNRK